MSQHVLPLRKVTNVAFCKRLDWRYVLEREVPNVDVIELYDDVLGSGEKLICPHRPVLDFFFCAVSEVPWVLRSLHVPCSQKTSVSGALVKGLEAAIAVASPGCYS